jgi:hypothetical protein
VAQVTGTGKRVVSVALFRHPSCHYEQPERGNLRGAFFTAYLPLLVRAHHACWPGWELRIHHDESLYAGAYGGELLRLERAGLVRLVYMGPARTLCGSMLWRLAPVWDPEVEIVACRDVDALPQPRDRAAVEHWARGAMPVHVIHDSPAHLGVMGGTLALRAADVRPILGASFEAFMGSITRDLNEHGADQHLLSGLLPTPVFHESLPRVHALDRLRIGTAYRIDVEAEVYGDVTFPARAAIEAAEEAVRRSRAGSPRAIISSDLNPAYSFFLPLTAALWRHVASHRPTALLTGTCEDWRAHPQGSVALRHLREQGADVFWIGTVTGHRSSTVAQVSRLFAGCLDLPAEDRLLTADVDMWPLAPVFRDDGDVTLHYGNAYAHEAVPKWPLCYVGAKASTWREIMGVGVEPIAGIIQRHLDERLAADEDSWAAWNHDEEEFARRLVAWPGHPERCVTVPRRGGPPVDRIDRSAWPAAPNADGMVDAHLPRPGAEGWSEIRPLIEQVAPHLLEWADAYVQDFRRAGA